MDENMAMLLTMLKTDLGIISSTAYDARLQQIITAAIAAIKQEGATTLSSAKPLDAQLIVMYAGWMWRRRDNMEGMPRMVRWALNNRIMAEKAGGSGD